MNDDTTHLPVAAGLSIWPDANNRNNLHIVKNGASLCKVYGSDPEDAKTKADMIVQALASPTQGADAGRLVEALEKAKQQFLFYAIEHRKKATANGDRKADVNADFARMCAEALASFATKDQTHDR